MNECKVCKQPARVSLSGPLNEYFSVNCNECGKYFMTEVALDEINELEIKSKVRALLTERKISKNSPLAILNDKTKLENLHENYSKVTVEELIQMFPKSISERMDRTLVNLVKSTNYPGDDLYITELEKGMFFTQSMENREVFFLMNQLIHDGFLEGSAGFPAKLRVTVSGWNHVAEVERKKFKKESNQGFVAMWFNEEMNAAAEFGFEKAIKKAGYKSLRIDKKDHNNKIDDEIIAEIQRSKFIVADFTGHRGGVYFEAGYAMGLGKPVIWTCREDHLQELHFDTRQYSHIVWTNEDDLYEKLYNRIRATIH